jgi:hypothetical protein
LSIISTAVYFRRIFNEFSIVFPVPFVIVFLNFFLFTLVFYVCNETYPSRYVKTMDGIFLLMCIYLFYKSIRIFFLNRYQDEKLESRTRRTT